MNNWVIKLEEKIGIVNTATAFQFLTASLIVTSIVLASWQLIH